MRTVEQLRRIINCEHQVNHIVNSECHSCALIEATDSIVYLHKKILEEKEVRIKYQDIVYKICQLFDGIGIENKCTVKEVFEKVRDLKHPTPQAHYSEETVDSLGIAINDLRNDGFVIIKVVPILSNEPILKFFIIAERK